MQEEMLKCVIKDKYGTEANMARAMNWPRQRLNKITTGKKVPNVGEVSEIARTLGISVDKAAQFFLL